MGSPIRVLHVDDDPAFVDLVATFLERESDLTVVSETSAADGLETFERADVECVVSDYDMPRTDGLEFLQGVRERDPDVPFVLFTGKGSEEIASEAISAGVTDYMQKGGGTDQYTVLANRVRNAARQYRSQRQAEQMQQRLEEVAESTTDCIWMFTSDWDDLLFVSGYEDVWGRPSEAIRENPEDFLRGVHPDDREFVRGIMEDLSDGESIDAVYRITRGDDETGWVWVKGEPVLDDDGSVVRVVGFTRDVTERKRRERTLQEEREFIEQAINALDDVFYVVGTDGTLRRWNDSLEATTGYDGSEIAEMDVVEFFAEDHRARISDAVRESFDGGEVTVEAEFETARGRRIPHEFTGARLTDPEGELIGLVGVGRDISERKERERELKRQNERFDELAGVISHDLETPIQTVRGRLELAAETGDPAQIDEALDALQRVDELREDIVDMVRSREVVGETETVEVAETARSAWRAVTVRSDASLEVEDTVRLDADPDALRRLLQNLLSNSVEHASGAVSIRIGALDHGFYLADSGSGIPEEHREDVFTPGFTTKAGGSGMGMASVRQILDAHGWRIEVTDSEALGGVRFEVLAQDGNETN
ncbi:PAS domain S-box protein [Halostella litorea]|uniref:PAS domain S-box protein n=1 Tax=Halostella litorea TaxID=2528831 RepID=UPI001091CB12|nr:PAS domain S-box protein [Halostella litorea]